MFFFFLEEWKVEKTSPKWRIKCQRQKKNSCDHMTHLPFLISSLIDFLPGVWFLFLKKELQSSNNSKRSCICCLSAGISTFYCCYENIFLYHSVCLTFTWIFNIFLLIQYQSLPQYHLNTGAAICEERNSQKLSSF